MFLSPGVTLEIICGVLCTMYNITLTLDGRLCSGSSTHQAIRREGECTMKLL